MRQLKRLAVVLHFYHDSMGKMVWKRIPLYESYHKGDLNTILLTMSNDDALVVNYQHGHTKTAFYKLLKKYPHLTVHLKSKWKVFVVTNKNSEISLEITRKILEDELWRNSF